MEVKIYAFELKFRHGIFLDDLFTFINEKAATDRDLVLNFLENGGTRPKVKTIITTSTRESNSDYLLGLSLNIKDISAFCKLAANGGKLSMSAEQLTDGSLMTDFNFFVIHKPTGRGLYQHYHHSQATTTFCNEVRRHYRQLRSQLIDVEMARLIDEEGKSDKRARALAGKKYFHFLDSDVLVRAESMESSAIPGQRLTR